MQAAQQWSSEQFCGSRFWDWKITWDTESPNFTPCFQKTVLVWLPAGFLSLATIVQILRRKKSVEQQKIPWTCLHLAKVIICLLLVAISTAELYLTVQRHLTGSYIPTIDFISLPVKVLVYILAFVQLGWNRSRGRRSVTVLFFFWLFQVLCGVVPYIAMLRATFGQDEFAITDSHFTFLAVSFPIQFCQLVLTSFSEAEPPGYKQTRSPMLDAPFMSRLTYSWMDNLMFTAFKRTLSKEDFPPLPPGFSPRQLLKQLNNQWTNQLRKFGILNLYGRTPLHLDKVEGGGGEGEGDDGKGEESNGKKGDGGEGEGGGGEEGRKSEEPAVKVVEPKTKPSLVWTMFKAYWPSLVSCWCLELTFDFIGFLPPIVLNLVIKFISSAEPVWKGYLYAFALFGSCVVGNVLMAHYLYFLLVLSTRMRTALTAAIYRKSLVLSMASRQKYTVGELVNLMSVDSEKIYQLALYANLLWGAPIRVFLTIVMLWQYLGPSCLAGVATIILTMPVTGIIARQIHKIQEKQMKKKDLRLKHMNEILNGIKVLKLCAWELPFMNVINQIRNKEVKLLRSIAYLHSGMSFTWSCVPFLIAVSSFITFVLVDEKNILDPSTAFVSLTLFNMLRFSLVVIPDIISNVIQTKVSLNRISNFFMCEELNPGIVGNSPDDGQDLSVTNGTFSWDPNKGSLLKNLNVHVPSGALVAVVGQVGAGKSSLLSAFLGEMYKIEGTVNIKGKIAYVPQQAWIQNATLRQNILFSKSYEETVYNKVLDYCSLRPDLDVLTGGDLTEIGDKGVNLSGGQKQRVSLARAVYQDADLYLLDDPLSAVDAHVGKHIFRYVVGPQGVLHKKTRILVTHDISYLPEVDFIISMNNGKIDETGTYKELMNMEGSFAKFVKEHQNKNVSADENEDTLHGIQRQVSVISEKNLRKRYSSQTSRSVSIRSLSEEVDGNKDVPANLLEDEKMELGKVKAKVYYEYLKHASYPIVFATVLSYIIYNCFEIGSNMWLSSWTNDHPLPDGSTDIRQRNIRIVVYVILGVGGGIGTLMGSIMLAKGTTRASRILHHRMLDCVMKTPMSFFDTTPLGRILNRFGKDMDIVDTQMPAQFDGILYCGLAVLSTLVVISINTSIFIAAVIPLLVIYYMIQKVYIDASRQMKRLESVTRSPIFSHFAESVQGGSSIRAYRAQERFMGTSDDRISENLVYTFNGITANRWLSIRLDLLGALIVLATALLAVASKGTIDAGIVGLSLTYALSVTEAMTWLVRMSSELETKIVSVERMEEYSNLSSEAPWYVQDTKPHSAWPDMGSVSFVDYSTRYRPGIDLVLVGVDLDINPRQKVGIVGRTGAGKSSLTLALFRIIEAAGGSIVIDGIDVSKIGLHELRARITIIPQDPILFTGSLRMNLDPNNKYTDEEVWIALEHAHLKQFVSGLNEGLQHEVTEGGENLSVGQRQLVCLARALLKKTKILVLDEATAAVDMETDKLIQNTIREEFFDCTIITIAHRLHTILDSDRVVVMDKGKIAEYGSPSELLEKSDSLFYGMAKDARLI